MTNTIPNVPRELLERAWRALANSATGREIGAYLDADPCAPECAETCARASMCSTCSATLSAPSPAGVDDDYVPEGLAQAIMQSEEVDAVSLAAKSLEAAGVDGWDVAGDILEKLSAAQAIIDGLRDQLDTYNRMHEEALCERDHLAQCLKFARTTMAVVADNANLRGVEYRSLVTEVKRIDAALSAGKEGAQ